MSRIALVGALGGDLENEINEIENKLKELGKVALVWSIPVKYCKEEYENEKFWFYLYQDGTLKARCRVIDFKTKEGNDGIECPQEWTDFLLKKEWEGKKNWEDKIFKTWFLIDEVEKLENEIPLEQLRGFCGQKINSSRLINSFLYIYDPLFSEEDLKKLISKFIEESINKNTLETKKYKAYYKNLEIKVSFGQGQQAKTSWMAFLGYDQKVQKGIYPVILFDREDCLVLAFGVSEDNDPNISWPNEVINEYEQIRNAQCEKCDLPESIKKYSKSYLKKCYQIKGNQMDENQLDDLIQNLNEIIELYNNFMQSGGKPNNEVNDNMQEINCLNKSNLKLENHIINSFYNSLKTKGFVILAGLSGTGKTKIFEEFVRCFPVQGGTLSEKWLVIKETEEKLTPVKKEEIELNKFNKIKIEISDFIKSINETLGEKTNRRVCLKIGNYYTELIPVIKNVILISVAKNFVKSNIKRLKLNKKTKIRKFPKIKQNNLFLPNVIKKLSKKLYNLKPKGSINSHSAVYIGSLFGFEIIERDDIKRLNLKELNKEIEIKEFFRIKHNNLFFPIRPDFKDTKSLLGFYNPLKNQYHLTPLLDFIIEAAKNYLEKGKDADPFFVLFDEMNLARVEYYFADFLSVLESKRFENKDESLGNISFREFTESLGKNITDLNDENYKFTSQSIKLHSEDIKDVPKELFLPPNLYFVGTVNIDETTHMFSPKVLDRAFTIEFNVGSFEEYLDFLNENIGSPELSEDFKNNLKQDFTNNGNFAIIDKQKIKEFLSSEENKKYINKLEEINKTLRKYNLHFGYRVFDEIIMFLYNCKNSYFRFDNLDEAFDLAIKMKILPKFHGTRQKLWDPIIELLKTLKLEEIKEQNSQGNTADVYSEIEKIKSIPTLDKNEQNEYVIILETSEGKKVKVKTKYKHTVLKLLEMLYRLKAEGFASFM